MCLPLLPLTLVNFMPARDEATRSISLHGNNRGSGFHMGRL